jgi:hypothetical protein
VVRLRVCAAFAGQCPLRRNHDPKISRFGDRVAVTPLKLEVTVASQHWWRALSTSRWVDKGLGEAVTTRKPEQQTRRRHHDPVRNGSASQRKVVNRRGVRRPECEGKESPANTEGSGCDQRRGVGMVTRSTLWLSVLFADVLALSSI